MDKYIRSRLINKENIKDSMSVLDAGTGTGRNLPLIRKCVGENGLITGVDISEGMLSRACHYERHSNVNIIHSNIYDYTPVKRYDIITISYVLCVVPEPNSLLEHLKGLLKPDGKLLLLTASFPKARSVVFQKMLELEEWIAAADLSIQPPTLMKSHNLQIESSFRYWKYINGFTASV
jgi:ubiquinone/menaquinone biosynthesis C-methylase UbiE